ncbi:MAG TPA: hypothetical protein VLL25_09145 [Acidimicrobiales bacterium]|nr:hypothetical protein [Acidimicrobiales bacterium]
MIVPGGKDGDDSVQPDDGDGEGLLEVPVVVPTDGELCGPDAVVEPPREEGEELAVHAATVTATMLIMAERRRLMEPLQEHQAALSAMVGGSRPRVLSAPPRVDQSSSAPHRGGVRIRTRPWQRSA